MRNPERIDRIMHKLTIIWKSQPDTRFNQLVHNLQFEYSRIKNDYGKRILHQKEQHKHITSYLETHIVDLFNLEDDDFELFLEEYIEKNIVG